ncbi:hypothetical protein [uncultured Micrococcus sp.]|uniref:hypothetical protein n=1 Tax=uncultured Micrococcus sp. TaxID=114051 RepID=UPI0025913CEC|nr:hypothetical protein [uncultured Micrococcus sp.]
MAGPFARFRQSRADDRELGLGLWRRGHDRYARALDRYWQVVEATREAGNVGEDELNGLVHAGNALADARDRVRTLCTVLHRRHPSGEGGHIPPSTADAHRELSRAAHELAATAQAAAMFRLGQGSLDSVGRHAERTLEHVAQAERSAPRPA